MDQNNKPKDIIIADNQYLIIEGLKTILNDKYNIRDTVTSKDDLDKALRKYPSGILIIDYTLIDFNGFRELNEMKTKYPSLVFIVLTNNITRKELIEVTNAGIKNLLHKNCNGEEIFQCLEAAVRNKKYYSDSILDLMLDMNDGKTDSIYEEIQLTNSEIDIVRLIAQGLTTKEIANQKFLSFHTVMTHRKNILRKLGVSNASELIMYAITKGIIDTIEYHI